MAAARAKPPSSPRLTNTFSAPLQLKAEIKIHSVLKHRRVVEYKHFFEDRTNCYILLELCHNQSMNELIKRRKRLTEPEVLYFMMQLIDGTKYMHNNNVIHRDLKLGNLFIDRYMGIKIGDLGLATKLSHSNERKRTICGTPNYIAPEIIDGKGGHSFQVDIWSMGVIMYTLLVGKPPYEAKDVKSTYKRILANVYSFPDHVVVSEPAKNLIRSMLQSKPDLRPTLDEVQVSSGRMSATILIVCICVIYKGALRVPRCSSHALLLITPPRRIILFSRDRKLRFQCLSRSLARSKLLDGG